MRPGKAMKVFTALRTLTPVQNANSICVWLGSIYIALKIPFLNIRDALEMNPYAWTPKGD